MKYTTITLWLLISCTTLILPCIASSYPTKALRVLIQSDLINSDKISKDTESIQSMPSMRFGTKQLSQITVVASLLKVTLDIGLIKKLGEVYDIRIIENDFRLPQEIIARTTQKYKISIHWNKLFTHNPVCTIHPTEDVPRASSHRIICLDKSNKWHVEIHNRNSQGNPLEFIALKIYQNVLKESIHKLSLVKAINL